MCIKSVSVILVNSITCNAYAKITHEQLNKAFVIFNNYILVTYLHGYYVICGTSYYGYKRPKFAPLNLLCILDWNLRRKNLHPIGRYL